MSDSQGWRDIKRRGPARRRSIWRGAVALMLLGLVGAFVVLLTQPFRHPNSHLIYAVAGGDSGQGIAPPPFALEQYAQLNPLRQVLFRSGDRDAAVTLVTPAELSSQAGAALSIGSDDAVLVYLAAHQAGGDAGPKLRPSGGAGPQHDLSLNELLARLAALPGRIKLLILDTTTPLVADDGLLLPEPFSRQLDEAVRATGDRSLWVLNAHSLLEQSHRSLALRRTVFGYFVARGLKGDADLSGDRVIQLNELLTYVRSGVDRWADLVSDGHAPQTPQLYWGGGTARVADAAVPLLAVVPLPPEQRELDVQQGISDAKQPRQRGEMEQMFRGRIAREMSPVSNPIRDRLGRARLPSTMPAGRTDSASGADQPQANEAPQGEQADAARYDSDGDDSPRDSAAGATFPQDPQDDADLLELLARAWAIHDALLQPRRDASRPIDDAPHLWRQYQQQLLVVDQAIGAGWTFQSRALHRTLNEQLLPMQQLLADAAGPQTDEPQTAGQPSLVDAFMARKARFQSPQQIASLALLRAAGQWRDRFDAAAVESLERCLELIHDGTAEDFRNWIDESWQSQFQQLSELRELSSLVDLADTDWPLLRQLLRCRMQAEQAAVAVASRPAFHPRLLGADRLRREAENALRARTDPQWRQLVEDRLSQAEQVYDDTLDAARAARRVEQLVHDHWAAFPHLAALHRHGRLHPQQPFPNTTDLDALLMQLRSAEAMLAEGTTSYGQLHAVAEALQAAQRRLTPFATESQLQRLVDGNIEPSDAWYVRLVLRTPLVPVAQRMRLIAIAAELEAVALRQASFNTVAGDAASRLRGLSSRQSLAHPGQLAQLAATASRADDWVRWQAEILAMADGAQPLPEQVIDAELLRRMNDWPAANHVASEFPTAFASLRSAVSDQRQQLPARLGALLDRCSDLSNPASRGQRLARLQQLRRWTRVIAAPLEQPFSSRQLAQRLASANRYDQLAWMAARDRAALEDTSDDLRAHLTAAIRDYQTLAQAEPLQPPLPAVSAGQVELIGPKQVVFGPDEVSRDIAVEVTNRGASQTDVFLVVETDPRYLEAEHRQQATIYTQHDLRQQLDQLARQAEDQRLRLVSQEAERADDASDETRRQAASRAAALRRAASYPLRPDLAELPATVRLGPGASRTFSLTLRRQDRLHRQTQLVVRAISAADTTRQGTVVQLPDRAGLRVAIDAPAASLQDDGHAVRLLPYPNRPTPYRIQLANTLGRDHPVTTIVLTPQRPLQRQVPETALSVDAAKDWLRQAGPMTIVAPARAVTLAASGPAVTLLPAPKPDPDQPPVPPPPGTAAAQPPPSPDDQPSADDETDDSAAPSGDALDVTHGLLLVVHDEAAAAITLQHLELTPQRPRRYVSLAARYDARLGQLVLDASPIDPSLVPAQGIPVTARLTDPSSGNVSTTLSGRITGDGTPLQLTADIAPDATRQWLLEVDVDRFPRAFLFRFHAGTSQPNIGEWVQRRRVRITAPQPNTAYQLPRDWIDVSAAVDAPVGAFLDPRDRLQIGIDVNRDRVFRDESPLVLRADRQVKVLLLQEDDQQPVQLLATVGDFRLQVPSGTKTDTRVNVLGHLRSGGEDTWSEPIEIILDGRPPDLASFRVLPSRRVVQGDPLQVSVSADDHGLAGVAEVKIGWAADGRLDFADAPAAVEAELGAGGVWAAEVPTQGLASGLQQLLVQATDRVGNLSEPHRLAITVLSQAEMEAEKNQPKPVAGVVMHGNTQAAGATVQLFAQGEEDDDPRLVATRTADASGHFRFARVAPGSYRLEAKAFVRNNRRSGELDVTVPEGDQRMKSLTLMIR